MSESGFMKSFFDVRPDERRIAVLMAGYFFLVITSFWILKPLKKILFIGHYAASGFDIGGSHFDAPQAEALAKILNMVIALVAATTFALLSRTMRRQQLTYVFTTFFIVAYGVFALVLREPSGPAVWGFYLFGDLFSTLMVATFFTFLNDSVSSDAAKRLYGVVGFGGVLGGVFGSSAVGLWISALSIESWLLLAGLIGGLIVVVARAAAQSLPADLDQPRRNEEVAATQSNSPDSTSDAAEPARGGSPFEGILLIFRSPYLLSIVAIVGLYEMVSTILDFQFTNSIIEFSETDASRGQNFATVFAATNWLSMFVQLFLTSFVMKRLGLATALMILPCTIAMASTGFVLFPSLIFGALLNVSDNAFSYSVNQSAKEALYVPTTVEEKYQAKAFIDMFLQRVAKAVGVGLSIYVTSRVTGFEAVPSLSYFLIPVLVLWSVAAIYAGRKFTELETKGDRP